ncbi:MAG: hypothetical protein JWL77_1061 [Chthonomonadaceae bacterium]|nr:hypothetical protein [Chthonomonadaceae bacterium]
MEIDTLKRLFSGTAVTSGRNALRIYWRKTNKADK